MDTKVVCVQVKVCFISIISCATLEEPPLLVVPKFDMVSAQVILSMRHLLKVKDLTGTNLATTKKN
jgi:hypothetical protein